MGKLVLDRKVEVLDAIYEAMMEEQVERELAEEYGITREDHRRGYLSGDNIIVGLEIDGDIAGGMIFVGKEVHLGIRKKYRGAWVRNLKRLLDVGFAARGNHLVARVNTHSERAKRFVESVGCTRSQGEFHPWYVVYDVIKEGMRYGFGNR